MELSTDFQLLCDSAEFKELANFYANKSILDIVGISRLEKVHSNFLYWLFNINESHQLGTIPFRNFLFSCVGQKYRMIGNYELVKNMEYIFPNDWTDILLPYKEQYDKVRNTILKDKKKATAYSTEIVNSNTDAIINTIGYEIWK